MGAGRRLGLVSMLTREREVFSERSRVQVLPLLVLLLLLLLLLLSSH